MEARANTKAIESQILLERTASVMQPFTTTPELLSAFEKVKRVDGWDSMTVALMRRYGLDPEQATAWFMFLLNVWRGDVTECSGIDAFTLLPHDGEWKVPFLACVADGN